MSPTSDSNHDGPPGSIAAGLFKLALVIRHQSWKTSGERGLTPTQSQILVLLASLSGEVGVKMLAEQLAVTVATASEAVTALERKDLLTKAPSPRDGRAIVLTLTRVGRRQARRSAEWPEVLVQAAESLPAAEQAGLMRGLVGMVRDLQEKGAVPMSRMCVSCRFFRPNETPEQSKAHYCGFIQAAIGDAELRVDCQDMEPVDDTFRPVLWNAFASGAALPDDADSASACAT